MPLVATAGAANAGGAVFQPLDLSEANPVCNGGKCIRVGDTSVTACSLHDPPIHTTVVTGSVSFFIRNIPVALVGSQTSCGHPIISPGTNATVQAS